jgi:hypothetical protein
MGALSSCAGEPVELLFPAGLAAGLLAIPLIALYFLRLRRRRVRVPSLLPWAGVLRSDRLASPFQRFRRHRLLLLQLLALAAIVLALARPASRGTGQPGRALVLVVDLTASMGATDVAPDRLGAGVAHARELVDALGPDDEVLLVTAAARTEVLVPFTRDHGEVSRALGLLRPTVAAGTLREGVELGLSLARGRPAVEVVLISDGAGADLHEVNPGAVPFTWAPVGTSAENAGIVQVDLRRGGSLDLSAQLFAAVENRGPTATRATVEAWLGSEMIAVRNEELPSGEVVPLVFDLPADAHGVVEVRLVSPGDQLRADDRAWAVVEAAGRAAIGLVGGDALTDRVLSSDPRVRLERLAPGEATADRIAGLDALVFGSPVPDGLDGVDYLVLGPRLGGPVRFGADVAQPKVLDWSRGHPLNRAVRWSGVTIGRVASVVDRGGLTPIVDSDGGPLLLAGERAGGRVAVLAFDPFESDLPLRVAWPVLLLDAVGWLAEGPSADARAIATGETWIRRIQGETDHADVRGPAGAERLDVRDGIARVAHTERAGVYTVSAAGHTASFAANLASPAETDIRPPKSLPLGSGTPIAAAGAGAAGQTRAEWWRSLALVGLAILSVEWLAWGLGRTG